MKNFVPRPYQLKAHEQIEEAFKRAVKLLLVMSTGAGKSKTAISFIQKHLVFYNWIIVVRKKDLVNQLADDLTAFGLDFGVFMADDPRYAPKKSIQLCSIDTIGTRELYPFLFDSKDIVLIIDEADESNADTYQTIIQKYTKRHELRRPSHFSTAEMLKPMRPAFLLGMTATPYDDALPHFDEYIEPVSAEELRDVYKALVPYRYFIPKLIDLSDVRISDGEFNSKDLDKKLNTPQSIQECFEAWLRFGDNRQTLVFTSNKAHAEDFANYINEFYGQIVAVAIDADTPSNRRREVYKLFRNGAIRFITNVRLVTRGVDIPEIGTILDCAPTLRINNHIQKIGRGSRQNGIYKDLHLICCANNLVNNGPFYYKRIINLKESRRRNKKEFGEMMKVCLNCFRASEPHEFVKNTCPFCNTLAGKVKEKKLSKAAEKRLEIEEASPEKIEQLGMIKTFKKHLWQLENIGRKYPNNIAREKAVEKLIKDYGEEKVLKIRNAIRLDDALLKRIRDNRYVPLGGL